MSAATRVCHRILCKKGKTMEDFTIAYLHPVEPEDGEAVVAAIVTWQGQEERMTIRGDDRGDDRAWRVEFGNVADEGSYPTYSEALEVAHRRALDDAEESVRATRDGGY